MLALHSVSHDPTAETYHDNENHIVLRPVTALSGMVRDYELRCDEVVMDVGNWLVSQFPLIDRCFAPLVRQYAVRAMFFVKLMFVRVCPETGAVVERMSCFMPSASASHIVNLREWYESHIAGFQTTFNKFLNREGSEWQYDNVDFVLFKTNLSLSYSGRGIFKLPTNLSRKQAVINVNCDSACFKYALLSVLHHNDISTNRNRVIKYREWEEELKFEGVDVNEINISKDIPKIERQNNLKINVHVWERGLQGCRYNNRLNLASRTVNLLLICNDQGERHYCGITSLSRLYYHSKKSHNLQHMCERCIRSFESAEKLETHFQWCVKGKAQIENMPKERDFSYTSFGHELSPLRVVYADAECFIEPDTQSHQAAAIACHEVWHPHLTQQRNNSQMQTWVGEGCIEQFLRKLDFMVKDQHEQSSLARQSMLLSPTEQHNFHKSQSCPKCKEAYTEKRYKVRDHCHITGEYRGPLCCLCNTRLRLKRNVLPVIFHNFKNYDAHLLIKEGVGKLKHWKLSVIAQSKEKFMSMRAKVPVGQTKNGKTIFFDIVFVDSYQFMPSSLATLANNLDSLPLTQKLRHDFPNLTNNLITRKGVFPYSYFSSLSKLDETCLPPRNSFTNDLTQEDCSEDDYVHAQEAWRGFECRTFGDYMLAYLKLDVYLLADVFEQFRRMSLEQDGLDPIHFISLPGLSFMSAFKMTGETIHLLQDADLYTLFERGIRGGLTFVNKHRVKTKITNMGKNKIILLYIDQNNLYGQALCEFLPHSNFVELRPEDVVTLFPDEASILAIDKDGDVGFLFEVDLEYPSNLHDKTKDFPLAPESGEVTEDMLSPFMKQFYKQILENRNQSSTQSFKSSRKLLLTQNDKEHYVVHFSLLQFYLEMGMKIKKIHRVIRFTQKRFLEPYVKFNSERRAQARNSFEKDFYKLKNNSLFGKTMEDVRKRMNYKLITNENAFQKLVVSPLFLDRDIITEDIVGVKMMKPKVTLDKPIYIGQAVLDYSKLTMYKLFYQTLPQCPLIHKLELLGGDTDSFFLSLTVDIQTSSSDILKNLESFVDFSNYPTDHPLFSNVNKAKLGCFKDECAGREIKEMILLKPKMYSIKMKESNEEIKRAKGVSKSIVRNLRHEKYKQVYKSLRETNVQMTILKSIEHRVHTFTFNKRALSCWEDKRCWLSANKSLPHGNVDSPIPPAKRCRVDVPSSGDVV